ncbi:unnamed protein product, partial [Meganyctiphanes norvegica]
MDKLNTYIAHHNLREHRSRIKQIHYIPCRGIECKWDKFYQTPYQPSVVASTLRRKGTLRGYPLDGAVMSVPEGYTGVVLKETRPSINEDDDRTLRGICQFKEFTYWNLDREPGQGDKFNQAMNWMEIAGAIHDRC